MKKKSVLMCLAAFAFPFMAAQARPAAVSDDYHECTSWIIKPDLTGGKTMILHKNRDSKSRTVCLRHESAADKYQWIAVGDYNNGANMGLNSKGVAVAMNSGDPCDGISTNKKGAFTPMLGQMMLANCASAAEALKLLEKNIREKNYMHGQKGSIWFIADAKEAYIVEHDAVRFAAYPIVSGFAIRANTWHYPEMMIYSQRPTDQIINHYRREIAVRQCLFEAGKRYKEPVTVEKIAEASRIDQFPEDPKCYPLCGYNTNSAATITIDLEYPELLSTVYGAFGPPRYTAYLPVPILLDRTKVPEELAKVIFSKAVVARWTAKKELLPQDKLVEFELDLNKHHAAAVEEARKKLKNGGKREDVQKILTAAFLRNWEKLRKLSEDADAKQNLKEEQTKK